MKEAEVLGLWVALDRGPFFEDRDLIYKMMEVMNRLGGLIPTAVGLGAPLLGPLTSEREVWGSALIIRQDGQDGRHRFNKKKLLAQARLTLIWVFGADNQGADILWRQIYTAEGRMALEPTITKRELRVAEAI